MTMIIECFNPDNTLPSPITPAISPDEKVLLIDEALEVLQREQPDKAQVVLLKFFVGMSSAEVAAHLEITERTVERHWAYAKAWLFRAIQQKA